MGSSKKWGIRFVPESGTVNRRNDDKLRGAIFSEERKCRTCDGWLMVVDFLPQGNITTTFLIFSRQLWDRVVSH